MKIDGEGFAYFRWHSLKWPSLNCNCGYREQWLCWQEWNKLRRTTRFAPL
jgi:hypothetical protein